MTSGGTKTIAAVRRAPSPIVHAQLFRHKTRPSFSERVPPLLRATEVRRRTLRRSTTCIKTEKTTATNQAARSRRSAPNSSRDPTPRYPPLSAQRHSRKGCHMEQHYCKYQLLSTLPYPTPQNTNHETRKHGGQPPCSGFNSRTSTARERRC
ncbi:unnamed protein product [Ectocarpus fasciculatus]